MSSGLSVFNKAASEAYLEVVPHDKAKLNSEERIDLMGK